MDELNLDRIKEESLAMLAQRFNAPYYLPPTIYDQFGRAVPPSARWFGGEKIGSVVNVRRPKRFTDAR